MTTLASITHITVLFKLISDIGIVKALVSSLIMLGVYLGIKYISQYKFTKTVERSGIKVSDESDLRFNPLFVKGTYFIEHELPNIEVFYDKPVRRQLVIDLLTSHFEAILSGCRDISEYDMSNWSSEQWTLEITRRFNTMLHDAKNNSRRHGIPEIAIAKFDKWINPSISLLFSYINTVGTSTAYTSNTVKTNTIFLIVNVLFNTMLGDAERSITSLNGDITGTMYKNNEVEPVEHTG